MSGVRWGRGWAAMLALVLASLLASAPAVATRSARLPAGDGEAPAATALPAQGQIQAAFAPWDDIEGMIVSRLDEARQQVLVQAYILTNRNITNALVRAHARGLDVRVLMDAGQIDKNSRDRLRQMREAGIGVWLETRYRNAHNKVIVIDAGQSAATVITGSFNFTWSAQHRNAENILVLSNNPPLAARYVANWQRHQLDAQAAP